MKRVALVLSIIAAVAMAVLNLTYNFGTEPDAVYTIANQHVKWQYAGK